MSEDKSKEVFVDFSKKNFIIKFKIKEDNEINQFKVKEGGFKLNITHIYYIPINNNINIDDFNVFKQVSEYADKFTVLTVKDGYAIINPLCSKIIIRDHSYLGKVI